MLSPNIAGQHEVLKKDYPARKVVLLLISFARVQLTENQVKRESSKPQAIETVPYSDSPGTMCAKDQIPQHWNAPQERTSYLLQAASLSW